MQFLFISYRSKQEIQDFLNKNEIVIKGKNCPAPIFSFEETGLADDVINIVR